MSFSKGSSRSTPSRGPSPAPQTSITLLCVIDFDRPEEGWLACPDCPFLDEGIRAEIVMPDLAYDGDSVDRLYFNDITGSAPVSHEREVEISPREISVLLSMLPNSIR